MKLIQLYQRHASSIKPEDTPEKPYVSGLYSWGPNFSGALGVGGSDPRYAPTFIPGDWNHVDSYGGYNNDTGYTFLIDSTGCLFACGANRYGQLGLGDNTQRTTPTRVGTASNWVKAYTSYYSSSFFINSDGELYASGYNEYGQLGLGDKVNRNVLTRVGTASNWVDVYNGSYYAGGNSTMFENSEGEFYSCGYNLKGQLGLGDTAERSVPTRIEGIAKGSKIFHYAYHVMFLTPIGELYGFGGNSVGQIGLGPTHNKVLTPTRVGSESNWVDVISNSGNCSYALNSNGQVFSFGSNLYGALGQGDFVDRFTPTQIGSARNWVKIRSNTSHEIFLINSNGEIYSCGRNSSGELGHGEQTGYETSLKRVANVNNITDIVTSQYTTMFIDKNGALFSCGSNYYGGLGLGDSGTELLAAPTPLNFPLPCKSLITMASCGFFGFFKREQ